MLRAFQNITLKSRSMQPTGWMFASTSTTTITPPTDTRASVGESHQKIETEHDGNALEWTIRSTEAEREADRVSAESKPMVSSQEPIYLTLSSLLPRKPGELRASRQVIALAPSVFNHNLRRDILHACVVHHLDSLRQGTASTKTRWEVKHSGRKLASQKGRGKARVGDAGNPIFRGGGVVFGPHPRDFSTKLPRKVREMGMRVALSVKLREKALEVVPSLQWPSHKTNNLWKTLKSKGWAEKTLFVLGGDTFPNGLDLASRNIQGVDLMCAKDLTVYDALKWKRVVMDVDSVGYFAEKFGKSTDAPEDISSAIDADMLPGRITQQPLSPSSLSHASPTFRPDPQA